LPLSIDENRQEPPLPDPSPAVSHLNERASFDPRIPIHIVTGPAGREKAALVERIAGPVRAQNAYAVVLTASESWTRLAQHGERIAPDMIRIPNGAVVCFGGSDIRYALYQLHLRKLGLLTPCIEYERVLIDLGTDYHAGDLAALVLNDDRIDASYRLEEIATLVSARTSYQALTTEDQTRIAEADTILICNASPSEPDSTLLAQCAITSLNPLARVARSEAFFPHQAPAWQIPLGAFREDHAAALASRTGMIRFGQERDTLLGFVSNLYNNARSNSPEEMPALRVLRMRIDGGIDLPRFIHVIEDLIQTFGAQVLRLAAMINVPNADFPIVFEVIGGTLLRPVYGTGGQRQGSDICIIARGLDAREAFRAFGRCVRSDPKMGAAMEVAL
jgi:G3E family GTPase